MLDELLERVLRWATERPDVRAVVLVGSHARGAARPDSDVDLVLLVERPRDLIADTAWLGAFGAVERREIERWGRVVSVRAWYAGGAEAEFGLATPDWATRPDDGTRRVLGDGARVLLDHDGVLAGYPGASSSRR
jgi:predicted nucleotidyltransferase